MRYLIILFLISICLPIQGADCPIVIKLSNKIKERKAAKPLNAEIIKALPSIIKSDCDLTPILKEVRLIAQYLAFHKNMQESILLTRMIQNHFREIKKYDSADTLDYLVSLRYNKNGFYKEAINYADSVLNSNERLKINRTNSFFNLNISIAFAKKRQGLLDEPQLIYEEILDYDSLDYKLRCIAQNNLLNIYKEKYLHKEMYEARLNQLEEAKKHKDSIGICLAFQGIAQMYINYDIYNKAVVCLNEALNFVPLTKNVGLYLSLNNSLAMVYMHQDSLEKAQRIIDDISKLDFNTWDNRHLAQKELIELHYLIALDSIQQANLKFEEIKNNKIFSTDDDLAFKKDLVKLKLITRKEFKDCDEVNEVISKYIDDRGSISLDRSKEMCFALDDLDDCIDTEYKSLLLANLDKLNDLQIHNLTKINELDQERIAESNESKIGNYIKVFLLIILSLSLLFGYTLINNKKKTKIKAKEDINSLKHEIYRQLNYLKLQLSKNEKVDIAQIDLISKRVKMYSAVTHLEEEDINIESVNIKELIEDIVSESKLQHICEIDINSPLVIKTDIFLTRQILENILDNSRKFQKSDKESKINITTSAEDNRLILKIEDNGIGFDAPEKLSHQWKKGLIYHTKEEGSNMGYGLFISHIIANRLNGKITINSKKNKGTSVSLQLPMNQ